MRVAVLVWVNAESNLVTLEANRVEEDAPEEPLIAVVNSAKLDIMFRPVWPNEPGFPGIKFYGLGRFGIILSAGSEPAGSGTCHALGMESAVLASIINKLLMRGCLLRCRSDTMLHAALHAMDPEEADDLVAITRKMVEEALGG